MATEKNKLIDAIGKLITLTQHRKLLWRPADPSNIFGGERDKRVEVVYEAEHNDRYLRLYRERYKVPAFPRDEWVENLILELTDKTGLATWSFPHTAVIEQLLSAVEYQVTGAGNFLDELLAEAV